MGGLYPRGPIDCGVQFVLDSKIDIFFLRKQLFITFDVILSWNTFENRKDESFKCWPTWSRLENKSEDSFSPIPSEKWLDTDVWKCEIYQLDGFG